MHACMHRLCPSQYTLLGFIERRTAGDIAIHRRWGLRFEGQPAQIENDQIAAFKMVLLTQV
jgi:hypothetical protein